MNNTNDNQDDIQSLIRQYAADNELQCIDAFKISETLNVQPSEVGTCANQMKVRLIHCQLGLFGYYPTKKIIKPVNPINESIKQAIIDQLIDNKITCEKIFSIAHQFDLPKLTVSGTCEALEIKIKPCQLGAF